MTSRFKAFRDYVASTVGADRKLIEGEFYGESDRACGILQASWVELALENLISQTILPRSPKVFGIGGSLSTFAAKIDFAYETKLIGAKTKHDLDSVRELRNGFAHSMVPIQFDHPIVQAICDSFQLLGTPVEAVPVQIVDMGWDRNRPRSKYCIVCYTIVKGLFDHGWTRTSEPNLPPTNMP